MEYWRFILIVISLLDRNNFLTKFPSCSLSKGEKRKKKEKKKKLIDLTRRRGKGIKAWSLFKDVYIYIYIRLAWLTADPSS